MKNRTTNTNFKDVNMVTSGSHFAYDHSDEELGYKATSIHLGMVTLEVMAMLTMAAIVLGSYLA